MNSQIKIVYNSILNDNKLLPLASFKSNKISKYNLFPDSLQLPIFFQTNLQSQGRIIKYLKGIDGPLRAFYYQLFKLGFQIEHSPPDYYSTIIKNTIFNPNLTVNSTSPISGKHYNIIQYQRIIAEFIKTLELQVIPNVELTVSQYPIIDQAMLSILELIVEKNHKRGDTLTQMLIKLCEIFNITLEIYENCFSFQESDVFLYVENSESFYLAFLSQMAEVQSFQQTSQGLIDMEQREQIVSASYLDNLNSSYKDIRLSAGNKGTRPKIINRSNIKQNNLNSPPNNSYLFVEDKSQQNQSNYNNYLSSQPQYKQIENQYQSIPHYLQKNVFDGFSKQRKIKQIDLSYKIKKFNTEHLMGDTNRQQYLIKKIKTSRELEFDGNELEYNYRDDKQLYNGKIKGITNYTSEKKLGQRYEEKNQKNSQAYLYKGRIQEYGSKNSYENLVKTVNTTTRGDFSKHLSNESGNENKSKTARFQNFYLEMLNLHNLRTFKSISEHQTNNDNNVYSPLASNKNIRQPLVEETSIIKYNTEAKYQSKHQIKPNKTEPKPITNRQYQHKNNYQLYINKAKMTTQTQKQPTIKQTKPSIKQTQPKSNNLVISPQSNDTFLQTFNTFNNLNTVITIKEEQGEMKTQQKIKKQYNHKPEALNKQYGLTLQDNQVGTNFYHPKPDYITTHMKKVLRPYQVESRHEIKNINTKNNKDETLGTFYREFSDTRVMNAMIQPHKSNVRKTRQKFKGIKSKNWKGFV